MPEPTLIRVGHSPDPDDAFMFHALANSKIDTGRYRFTHELQDIETLNHRALAGELELTAVSLHGYAYVTDKYALCSCGASVGDNYGPMVVSRVPAEPDWLIDRRIAVPGELTTAFLSLRLLLGDRFSYDIVPFDQILDVVAQGKADAGLIIHEGQLTYANQGLSLVVDLGNGGTTRPGFPFRWAVMRFAKTWAVRRWKKSPHSSSRAFATAWTIAPRHSLTRCSTAATSIRRRPTRSSACM